MAGYEDGSKHDLPLGLGTVQFGLDYGATNQAGKVPLETAADILSAARAAGVRVLDTAALYGDSERVLGELEAATHFDIVTKTIKLAAFQQPDDAIAALRSGFEQSCRALKTDQVYALMLHDPADLLGTNGDAVWRTLSALRAAGHVTKIGVSIYTGEEIDAALARYDLDIVQIPFNAVDNRLSEGGQLDRLAARNVEVHVRSAFLQGLLLQNPEQLPAKFQGLAVALTGLRRSFTDAGLTLMEGLLGSIIAHPAIGKVIVGTTRREEFEEIASAALRLRSGRPLPDTSRWQIGDKRILNPALWSTL